MLRASGLLLAFALLPTLGVAQDAPATPATPATDPTQQSAQSRDTLVFVLPGDLDRERRDAIEDAIGTQLELIHVRLVLLDAPTTPTPPALEERVTSSIRLAEEHHAAGVLWLDVRPTDHWFVYAMDSKAERVVVRPLFVRKESVVAAIEAVGVIARACAEALLRGEPVLGEAVPVAAPVPAPAPSAATPPPAPPPPAPLAARDDRVRFALGYRGESFAHQQIWQSGVNLSASFLWAGGPYAGLGFTWFPAHDFGSQVRFSVQRRPLSVVGGFRFHLSQRIDLDAELAGTFDIRTRHTTRTTMDLGPRPDDNRILFSLAPGVRVELSVTPWLGFFAAAALDVLFNEFDYLSSRDQTQPELYPYRARPTATAGVAFIQ